MNRLRLFGIGLAIAISLVALAPNQLIAFDGSQNEYQWIVKHILGGSSQDDDQSSANGRTDGYDGAEAEYLDISKEKANGAGGGRDEPRDDGRTKVPYLPAANKAVPHPC